MPSATYLGNAGTELNVNVEAVCGKMSQQHSAMLKPMERSGSHFLFVDGDITSQNLERNAAILKTKMATNAEHSSMNDSERSHM